MIDTEGVCIRLSDENVSRTGGDNSLLKNFTLPWALGQQVSGEYFNALISAFAGFEATLTDARANVREVALRLSGNESNPLTNLFEIEMQEGVIVEMVNPLSNAQAKAQKVMEVYNALGDIDKMYGCITVTESVTGEINAVYFERRT